MSASLPAEKSADFAISDGTRDTGSCNTWDAQLYSASVRSWCEEHGLQDPNPTRGGLGLLREVVSESRNTKSTLTLGGACEWARAWTRHVLQGGGKGVAPHKNLRSGPSP